MKVWITQHALTKGIEELEAEIYSTVPDVLLMKTGGWSWNCYGKGKNWHTDLDSAKKRANAMKDAKIKSLEKQLERVMDLNFD